MPAARRPQDAPRHPQHGPKTAARRPKKIHGGILLGAILDLSGAMLGISRPTWPPWGTMLHFLGATWKPCRTSRARLGCHAGRLGADSKAMKLAESAFFTNLYHLYVYGNHKEAYCTALAGPCGLSAMPASKKRETNGQSATPATQK